jgi:hypothetical protein
MESPLILRFFLSSPSDVATERLIAMEVLKQFPRQSHLAGEVFFEIVAWDDPDATSPLALNESPQNSIDRYKGKPSECDLTVVILWSRLGKPLPEHASQPDQLRYASGTMWEYEDAREAKKEIWLYRRMEPPQVALDDPDHEEKLRNYQALKQFFQAHSGGYTKYEHPDHFAALFKDHLGSLVHDRRKQRESADGSILDFSDVLESADSLCGREEIFIELDRFVTVSSCGYFRLTADSGLGKTTLAAAVARRFGAPAFFANYNGLTQADKCLNHLSRQFIEEFRLPYRELPPRAGEDSKFFEMVLKEASRATAKPLWFVVDGFDLADSAAGQNNFRLPARLPKGVYCFLTQRPGAYQLVTEPNTPLRDQELLSDSAMQQADIAAFLARELKRPEIVKTLATLPFDKATLLTRLREDSEGSFMYLVYVLEDLKAGDVPYTLSGTVRFPPGLEGYYRYIWSLMEEKAKGNAEWKSLYRAIIGLLAVAREAVTPAWLAELSGSNPGTVNEEVLSRWRRFLKREQRERGYRWRILHRSFAYFLGKELDLNRSHQSVVARYLQPKNWTIDELYASKHLSTHLQQAGNMDQLFSLVNNLAWYKSQIALDSTGAAYEVDLLQATTLASAIDMEEVVRGNSAPCLAQEIMCAFLSITLRGFWTNIRPNLLSSVVQAGVLNESQALTLALRNVTQKPESLSLVNLVSILSETILPKAVSAVRTFHHPHAKSNALTALAARFSGDEKQVLLTEALASAQKMEDGPSKVFALWNLALELPDLDQERTQGEALKLAKSLADPDDKAATLAALVDGNSPELLQTAVSMATSLEDSQSKAEYLVTIASHSPAEHWAGIVFLAKTVALNLDPIEKSDVLTSLLATADEGPEREDIFLAALEAARAIPDLPTKLANLLDLSDQMDDPQRGTILREVEGVLAEMTDAPATYAIGLCQITARDWERPARLADAINLLERTMPFADGAARLLSLGKQLSEEAGAAALNGAEQLARKIDDPITQARMLLKIGVALPDERMRPLVQEAARTAGGLLSIDQLEDDSVELLELVGMLASRLTPAHRKDMMGKARGIASGHDRPFDRPYDQARALAALLPALEPPERKEVCNQVLSLTRSLTAKEEQAELFTKILDHVDDSDRSSVFEETLESARKITPEFQITGRFDEETGRVSLNRMPEIRGRGEVAILEAALKSNGETREGLVREVFDALYNIGGPEQAELLIRLAPHLPGKLVRRVVDEYRSIVNDPAMNGFRKGLDERFAALSRPPMERSDSMEKQESSLLPAAETLSETDEGQETHFEIKAFAPVFRLSVAIPEPGLHITFDPPISTIEKQRDMEFQIFSNLAAVEIPADEAESIYADASALTRESVWHRAMAAVFDRLARLESAKVALGEARTIWPASLPPVVAGTLAALLGEPDRTLLLDEAIVSANVLTDSVDRIVGLGSLVPSLKGPSRDEVVRKVVAEFESVVDASQFSAALAYVRKFPRSAFLSFLQQILRSTLDRQMLLSCLREMVPELELLGGPGTAQAIGNELLDVSGWWS